MKHDERTLAPVELGELEFAAYEVRRIWVTPDLEVTFTAKPDAEERLILRLEWTRKVGGEPIHQGAEMSIPADTCVVARVDYQELILSARLR